MTKAQLEIDARSPILLNLTMNDRQRLCLMNLQPDALIFIDALFIQRLYRRTLIQHSKKHAFVQLSLARNE
jgi:hypothetical protein